MTEAERIEKDAAFTNRFNKAKEMQDEELIQKCDEWVSSLAKSGGQSWVLSIPVRYDKDPDMLFTELSIRLRMRNSELKSAQELNLELVEVCSHLLGFESFKDKFHYSASQLQELLNKAK